MGDQSIHSRQAKPSGNGEACRPVALTRENRKKTSLGVLCITGTRLLSSTARLKVEDIAASLLSKSTTKNRRPTGGHESALELKRVRCEKVHPQSSKKGGAAAGHTLSCGYLSKHTVEGLLQGESREPVVNSSLPQLKRFGGAVVVDNPKFRKEERDVQSVKDRLAALDVETASLGVEEEKADFETRTDPVLRLMGSMPFSPAQGKIYNELFSGASSYTKRQRGSVSDVMSRGIITANSFYSEGAVGSVDVCEGLMPTREDFPNYIYYLKEDIRNFGFEAATTGVFVRENEFLDSEKQAAYVRAITRVRRSQNILEALKRGIDLCRSTRDAYIETLLCRLRSGDLAADRSIGKAIDELMRINAKMAVIYENVEKAMSLKMSPEVKIDVDAISALKERLKNICTSARAFYRYPHIEDLADQIIKCICEETTLKVLQVRNRLVGEILVSKSGDVKSKAEHINHLCHLADGLSSAAELEWLFRSRLDYHNPDHSLNEVAIPAHKLMVGVQEHLATCDLVVFSAAMRHDSRMVFADPSDRCSKRQFGKDFMQSEGASFKIWQDSMKRASEELFYIYPQLIRIFPNGCLFSDIQLSGARMAIEKTVPEFLDFSTAASKSAGLPDGLDCVSNGGELYRIEKNEGERDPLLEVRDSKSYELKVPLGDRVAFYQEKCKESTVLRGILSRVFLEGVAVAIADLNSCVSTPMYWLESISLRLFAEMCPRSKQAIFRVATEERLDEDAREALNGYIKFIEGQGSFARGRSIALLERVVLPCQAAINSLKEIQLGLCSSKIDVKRKAAGRLRGLGIGDKISFHTLSPKKLADGRVNIALELDETILRLERFLNNLFIVYCPDAPFKVSNEAVELAKTKAAEMSAAIKRGGDAAYLSLAKDLARRMARENGCEGDISLRAWKRFTSVSGTDKVFLEY